jgi:hypothetical protein
MDNGKLSSPFLTWAGTINRVVLVVRDRRVRKVGWAPQRADPARETALDIRSCDKDVVSGDGATGRVFWCRGAELVCH